MEVLMKSPLLALVVLALASCSTAAPQVQVTSQTLATHSTSRPYVIDLTRSGTAYDVAGDIDYSRVRVRTPSGGLMTMEDFLSQRAGQKTGERVLLGDLEDLVGLLPPDNDSVAEAQCGQGTCTCTGRKDCSDLSKSGKCKSGPSDAICGKGFGGGSKWGCTCAMK